MITLVPEVITTISFGVMISFVYALCSLRTHRSRQTWLLRSLWNFGTHRGRRAVAVAVVVMWGRMAFNYNTQLHIVLVGNGHGSVVAAAPST